jgi:hypothetical protein
MLAWQLWEALAVFGTAAIKKIIAWLLGVGLFFLLQCGVGYLI